MNVNAAEAVVAAEKMEVKEAAAANGYLLKGPALIAGVFYLVQKSDFSYFT